MEFELNGIYYKIVEISQKEYKEFRKKEDENDGCNSDDTKTGIYLGATHYKTCTIYLDKDMPMERKIKTLYHELGHCYINEFIGHENNNFSEENVCDIIANSHAMIESIVRRFLGCSYETIIK